MNPSPFLAINKSCNKTLLWTKKQLIQAGLNPIQTFDLHAARVGLHDCSCPNHGTSKCDCQMVVMLDYGKAGEVATLILHGNDGQTWISLVNSPEQHTDPFFQSSIEMALQLNQSK